MTWWILSYTSVIYFFWDCDELLHCGLKLLVNMKLRECLQLQDETHHLKGTLSFVFHVACKESWNCDSWKRPRLKEYTVFFTPEKLLFWIPCTGRGTEQSYGGRDQPGRLGFRGWHLITFLLIHEVKLPTFTNTFKTTQVFLYHFVSTYCRVMTSIPHVLYTFVHGVIPYLDNWDFQGSTPHRWEDVVIGQSRNGKTGSPLGVPWMHRQRDMLIKSGSRQAAGGITEMNHEIDEFGVWLKCLALQNGLPSSPSLVRSKLHSRK